jgi:putative peptide zinc metalloprotease protein
VIQLPRLLYVIAEHADGRRDYEEISEIVSEAIGRNLTAENVHLLVDTKLRPLGVLAQRDGSSPPLEKVDPLLALKFRVAVVPGWLTRALTTLFLPFFFAPVVVAALATLAFFDGWFFFVHGVSQSTRAILYQPVLLLMVFGLVVLATTLHEIGHATACRYGGAQPGAMGIGLYLVWPAFYTDVTDAYRLDRRGRLRTDLGGVYFNCLFCLGLAAVYFYTRFEPLLAVVIVQHLQVVQQLLPFFRFDGYYVLSDLTGVPDMLSRVKPMLASFIPWRRTHERVRELKAWVRAVVVAYVLTVVPIILFLFAMTVLNAPRVFATAWDSMLLQYGQVSAGYERGATVVSVAAAVQMVALVLPAGGMVASFGRIVKRILDAVWKRTAGRQIGRAEFVFAAAAVAGWTAFIWWPSSDYVPIGRADRGTIPEAVHQFEGLAHWRPGALRGQPRPPNGSEPQQSPNLAPTGRPTTPTTTKDGPDTGLTTQTGTTTVPTRRTPGSLTNGETVTDEDVTPSYESTTGTETMPTVDTTTPTTTETTTTTDTTTTTPTTSSTPTTIGSGNGSPGPPPTSGSR